jgi:hypothetical protein
LFREIRVVKLLQRASPHTVLIRTDPVIALQTKKYSANYYSKQYDHRSSCAYNTTNSPRRRRGRHQVVRIRCCRYGKRAEYFVDLDTRTLNHLCLPEGVSVRFAHGVGWIHRVRLPASFEEVVKKSCQTCFQRRYA